MLEPAPVYWWTEPEHNIEERDVIHLATVELAKVGFSDDEVFMRQRIDAAIRVCKFRKQSIYNHIRQTGRRGPSWAKFMRLITEGVDCDVNASDGHG